MACYTGATSNFEDILFCFMNSATGGDPTILGLIILALVVVMSYQARLNGTLALLFGFVAVWSVNAMFGYTSEALMILSGVLVLGIGIKLLNGLLDLTNK